MKILRKHMVGTNEDTPQALENSIKNKLHKSSTAVAAKLYNFCSANTFGYYRETGLVSTVIDFPELNTLKKTKRSLPKLCLKRIYLKLL